MSATTPPTIDPVAAAHWAQSAPPLSPWLHEEVARRMAERLDWIRLEPQTWAHWEAVRGGLAGHALVAQRYPKAVCHVVEAAPERLAAARAQLDLPWWNPKRWQGAPVVFAPPPDASMQMLWANMLLHQQAEPQAMFAQWHRALAQDGFVMFSCLGPDTVRALHALYASLGWPAPGHALTDMHDWGDMLVAAGFADPVMDMEHITLRFASPERLLVELRELGRNLHPQRFAGLRTRAWRERLHAALATQLDRGEGLELRFEIIYGHALKPAPRVAVAPTSAVPLADMRAMLKAKGNPGP